MNFIELYINEPTNAKLDLDSELNLALQYSIADIRDISKRNAAYSKTISLPGTKNNNFWFGNLFDVNADFTAFNPNKKTDAKLLVNTDTVINGFLQLVSINKLNNADQSGNMIRYECVLFNNAVDLMTELGEKTLYELDLSEFSHTFNKEAVEDSWTHTWEDGYVYPIYGERTKDYIYNVDWFYPNCFYKTVFDRIITESGYGWTGSFKENAQFEKEIIAFVQDGNKYIDESEARRREFQAGVTADEEVYYQRLVPVFTANWPLLTSSPNFRVPFRYRDDSTFPNTDISDVWNTSTWEWTVSQTGTYKVDWGAHYDLILENDWSYAANSSLGTGYRVKCYHTLEKSVDGGTTWTQLGQKMVTVDFGNYIAAGGSASRMVLTSDDTIPEQSFIINTKVRLSIMFRQFDINTMTVYDPPGSSVKGVKILVNFKNSEYNYIKNSAKPTEIGQGSNVDISFFLPDKLKQKDLISDLIKRYNLYIEVSPDNPKVLIFTERPNFYNDSAEMLDWTLKKDFSREDKITLLAELQNKEMLFTYKLDKDEMNDVYNRETGDIYGQQKVIFDNDFVKGVFKVESPFASSPIVKTEWGALVSSIDPEKPKILPRVLYWGGLKNYDFTGSWQLNYIDTTVNIGAPLSQTYNQYPYAGHFDDPVNPRLDIDFGQNKFYFYEDWDIIPSNNMYNTYWRDNIKQIETGRMLTTWLYLDETDIAFIKDNFNTKIFLVDSYYYVNRIIDYKPLENDVTQVELIKIEQGVKWQNEWSTENESIGTTASCPSDMVAKRFKTGWYYVSASGQEVTQECCELIGGIWTPSPSEGSQGFCKARRVIKPTVIDAKDPTQRLNTDGNIGWGIMRGTNNVVGGTRTITADDTDWILSYGYWDDDGVWIDGDLWTDSGTYSADYNFEVKSMNEVYGSKNNVFGFNIETNGDSNIVQGEFIKNFGYNNNLQGGHMFVFGSNNTIVGDNFFGFGLNDFTATSFDTAYFGPSFSIDLTTGVATVGGLIPTGQMGLTYGTKDAPSLTWGDNILAGLWKVSSSERGFHAGVIGITVSSWDSKGLDMNNLAIKNYLEPYRSTNNSTTLQTASDRILRVAGTNTGVTVSLPETFSSGRVFTIKNVNPNPIDIAVGTASHTIDGDAYITLDFLDSVTLCGVATVGWLII